jgi:hypothetical protein
MSLLKSVKWEFTTETQPDARPRSPLAPRMQRELSMRRTKLFGQHELITP